MKMVLVDSGNGDCDDDDDDDDDNDDGVDGGGDDDGDDRDFKMWALEIYKHGFITWES